MSDSELYATNFREELKSINRVDEEKIKGLIRYFQKQARKQTAERGTLVETVNVENYLTTNQMYAIWDKVNVSLKKYGYVCYQGDGSQINMKIF